MYISENYLDLYLLENYPDKFVSLYGSERYLTEGSLYDIKNIISNVIKNIGSNLKNSGIDIKNIIKDIRSELSKSKNTIIDYLKKGDISYASNEVNNVIRSICFKFREFYKSRGILGKGLLSLISLFIVIMALLLTVWMLMNYAIIFVVLIIFIPIIYTFVKIAMNIIKFNYKRIEGFPENELNKTIIRMTEKIGTDRNIVNSFLANITKKTTDKLQKDLDSAIGKTTSDPRVSFTTKMILTIIKTVRDQKMSGIFSN